jgi:hypothetical protein
MSTNAATIIESSGKSVEFASEAGLYSCLFEHELKATKAPFIWTGPKLTQEQWNELMAFFKWTYDTEKSEAQARLFVHPVLGWKIWAFPQKGGTGMTTKEIENDDFRLQRAAVPEGYIAFGTVHHHCAAGAFQSGTDTHDERTVDGLHITVGKMDEPKFDIHCRMYIKGNKFEPHMDHFWEVGEQAHEKAAWLSSLNYSASDVLNREARYQMCVPPDATQVFPDLWKTNYILPPRPVFQERGGLSGMFPGAWCWHCQKHTNEHTPDQCPSIKEVNDPKMTKKQRRNAKKLASYQPNQSPNAYWDSKLLEEMWALADQYRMSDEDVGSVLVLLGGEEANPFIADLFKLLEDNYSNPEALYTLALKEWETRPARKVSNETAEETDRGLAAKTEKQIIEIYQGNGMMED